jgi:protein-tyrosine-phosphatase
MNIHFICRGNVFRSLIAETYLRSLNLKDINTISSGTNVNQDSPKEHEYFSNTLAVLDRHGIKKFTKTKSEQLTQQRINNSDVVVLMNQRVVDEALKIVKLPKNAVKWSITDIGEGKRTDTSRREIYEEEIYQEIKQNIDELLLGLGV